MCHSISKILHQDFSVRKFIYLHFLCRMPRGQGRKVSAGEKRGEMTGVTVIERDTRTDIEGYIILIPITFLHLTFFHENLVSISLTSMLKQYCWIVAELIRLQESRNVAIGFRIEQYYLFYDNSHSSTWLTISSRPSCYADISCRLARSICYCRPFSMTLTYNCYSMLLNYWFWLSKPLVLVCCWYSTNVVPHLKNKIH